jgi:FkbM family methyltransferase
VAAMKIFLDVGANTGQSLIAAIDSPLKFDKIISFEPAPQCWPYLKTLANNRVKIEKFGLWNKTCQQAIFQPGTKGAGMWKKDKGLIDQTQVCNFVRATDYFTALPWNADIWMKLNCEGAECDILDDLLDSGEFGKVKFLMVDFDVRKIAAMKHREAETMERLRPFGFPRISTSKEVMRGTTHQDRINNWLRLTCKSP